MLNGACEAVKGVIGAIRLQKTVTIKNFRLGLLQFTLKVAAGAWAVIFLFSMRAYSNNAVPVGSFFEAWSTAGLTSSGNHSSCTNPDLYDYVYNDEFVYNMSSCESLGVEAYSKRSSSLFFPTSIDDTFVWTFGISACGAGGEAEVFCTARSGSFTNLSLDNGVACQCQTMHSFFARDPEVQQIYFTHGFEASNLGVFGDGRMRGSTRLDSNEENYNGDWQDMNDQGILTIIQDQRGERCNLGGSSRYRAAEARQGIGGSLGDWMACAGVDLELADEKIRTYHPLEKNAPSARLTGLELNVQLDYRNVHSEPNFAGVVCYVRISAIQVWNSENEVSFGQLLDLGRSSYRSRQKRGTELRFSVVGRIDYLDFILLTTAISNILNIMSIPAILVGFLALYGLGPLSSIYTAASNSKVHVPDDCKTAVTRLITSEAAMSSIDKAGMTRQHVRNVLERILRKYIDPKGLDDWQRLFNEGKLHDGDIQLEELERLVNFVMESIDREDDASTVDEEEYLRLLHRNDKVQLQDIVKLFNEDRRPGLLERLFKDGDDFTFKANKPSSQASVSGASFVDVDPKPQGHEVEPSEGFGLPHAVADERGADSVLPTLEGKEPEG